ncbi:enoyl-CoA hydratase/isomerase family protein [Shewanella sp. D64]|uniref:enoyl-CoA hydratase/isomerase family protein n=1 Tax=unclassified Shewanella TaxID=196818 RepID=UPI0022BA221A|nr:MULTISPECIES: enoyl-CoA hydratase/isomerase family protein [unclassified Shewanella]MEC4726935.1 enoyl-CoA hydratase/isomerase family protein [Shewanella sp. D64]MEC4738568.1 enoyl-CoA hydratase/isomerase family protein [Shewanella sp. E94]WBJ93786.1 enoyl-CoA hydratase/isomerase family protein [Shewanella sp. MTB7]
MTIQTDKQVVNSNSVVFQTLGTASGKQIGVITLNVEKALNSLNLEMVHAMTAQLTAWQKDDDIALVMLDGAGEKSFCAGGDVRAIYHASVNTPGELTQGSVEFFANEYQLDYLLHSFGKPIMVWGDGIVMGGGLGLMAGASHRILTEYSRIAMPEVTIGLYPDVGGSYFLNRMPGGTGLFLGLTAYNMNAGDARFVGIGNHYLNSDDKEPMLDHLATLPWSDDANTNHGLLSHELDQLELKVMIDMPDSQLALQQAEISALMVGSLNEIVERVQQSDFSESWLARPMKTFLSGSPISWHLIYRQAQMGTELSLADVFKFELGLSVNCCAIGDFSEGVRALLIDKDRTPHWRYESVEQVPENLIEQILKSPWEQEQHPLKNM